MTDFIVKKHHLHYLLVLIVLIYSAHSIPFFFNAYSIFLPLVLSFIIYLYLNGKIFYNKKSALPFIGFSLLMVAYIIKFKTVDILFIAYHFSLIVTAFFVISTLRAKFFEYYEKIVYRLAILSLVLFAVQIIYEPLLVLLAKAVEKLLFIPSSEKYATMVIYTINHNNTPGFRNCGFAWEPGPYSVFLTIAVFSRFLINGIKFDKHIILLITAIITTLSTTGYIGLFALLGFYMFNKRKQILILAGPVVVTLLFVAFIKLPFLNEKIVTDISTSEIAFQSALNRTDNTQASIGRFSGFLLNIMDFKNNPILGFGGQVEEETTSGQLGLGISSTSGLGNWLAQFGVAGMLILLVTYFKSLQKIANENHLAGMVFVALMFLILSFGFNLLNSILFFCFMFYNYFAPKIQYVELNHQVTIDEI